MSDQLIKFIINFFSIDVGVRDDDDHLIGRLYLFQFTDASGQLGVSMMIWACTVSGGVPLY